MSNAPPRYASRLPAPLSALRRAALVATARRSRSASVSVGGFDLFLEPHLPDPRPRLGFSSTQLLVESLEVRPGERVLSLDAGVGWVGLSARAAGADVVMADADPHAASSVRRAFLVAGFGEPELLQERAADAIGTEPLYDLIAWVPPTVAGALEEDDARLLLRDRGTITAVLNAAPRALARGGRLLFPFPDRDATPWLHQAMTAAGLRFSAVRYVEVPLLGPVRLYKAWVSQIGAPGEVRGGEALAGAGWVLKDR